MTLADSRETSVENLIKNNAQAAVEVYLPRSNERVWPGSDPVSLVRRLDVDAVLARSVRKVVSE